MKRPNGVSRNEASPAPRKRGCFVVALPIWFKQQQGGFLQ
jgi:hypothetical protein